ncbi:PAS domain S-box-containing protein [Oceanisphaera litoralis]|uniref:hybrid sensor histidine kinase/response regulator n=1 Tax=Oceanisphaera litoralis TaxID=225144 RepID=UPI00195C475C|nr:response regulator [Oceanisphaera litoralis]MBM7455278.1 PAS domain S-box-containing protein [Oceanisphaera litoralis]
MTVEPSPTPAAGQAATLPKILAVDDRPENLHSLQRVLAGLQAEIITAHSGYEALALILRHDFAVILLDVMMPEMDGFETAGLIRGNRASQHVPIIFVTAADKDQSFEGKGYDLGAVDYLFKPLQPSILLSKVRVFLQLARQQQQLQQSLREVHQLRDNNELLLRSVGEGILSLDLGGHVGFANPAAAHLLGLDVSQVTGSSLTDFLLLTEQQAADEAWLIDTLSRHGANAGSSTCDQHWFRHAGGHRFPVEYTLSPLHDQHGKFTGVVLVFQDISERKEREALELASRYKSAFLATISHELRTPLHSLLILAKQLAANKEGNLNSEQLKAAGVIRREGQDLLRLINDILDLSKVEAGKMAMHWEPVSVADMLRHLQSQFAPLAAEKQLAFTVTQQIDLPEDLHTDRQRLQQILKNLLSNALKFTHQGEVALTVGLEENEAIAFTVSDTGIGIAAAKQADIFEAFQQVDVAINRYYEGTGLGLAICRELARLLGGRISLQSRPGQGSHFTLLLPLKPSSGRLRLETLTTRPHTEPPTPSEPHSVSPGRQAEPSPRLSELARGKNLLLVDGDMRNSFTLTAQFRQHGFRVIKADSYPTALARLASESRIDVLIMALMPPHHQEHQQEHQQARQLIRALQDGDEAPCPTLVLLASTEQKQAETWLRQEAVSCLVKPLDINRLQTRLVELLEQQLEQQAGQQLEQQAGQQASREVS